MRLFAVGEETEWFRKGKSKLRLSTLQSIYFPPSLRHPSSSHLPSPSRDFNTPSKFSSLQILQHLIHTIRNMRINLRIIIQRIKKPFPVLHMLCLRTGQAVFKRRGLRVGDLQPGVATGFGVFREQGVGLGFLNDPWIGPGFQRA